MVSFDNIIIYLRKSRSDDPVQTVEEVLAKHERILQDYCMKEYGKAIPEKRIYREVVSGSSRKKFCNPLQIVSQNGLFFTVQE